MCQRSSAANKPPKRSLTTPGKGASVPMGGTRNGWRRCKELGCHSTCNHKLPHAQYNSQKADLAEAVGCLKASPLLGALCTPPGRPDVQGKWVSHAGGRCTPQAMGEQQPTVHARSTHRPITMGSALGEPILGISTTCRSQSSLLRAQTPLLRLECAVATMHVRLYGQERVYKTAVSQERIGTPYSNFIGSPFKFHR